jgi:UDP-N-acetyl-D-glucosamine dehydrogenase
MPLTTSLPTFRRLLDSRRAVVGVIGLGYVGLPLALRFCEAGFTANTDADVFLVYSPERLEAGMALYATTEWASTSSR